MLHLVGESDNFKRWRDDHEAAGYSSPSGQVLGGRVPSTGCRGEYNRFPEECQCLGCRVSIDAVRLLTSPASFGRTYSSVQGHWS